MRHDGAIGGSRLSALAAPLVALVVATCASAAASGPVLSGLSQPTEPAATQNGVLYFAQLVAADIVSLTQLAHGPKGPVEVYRLVGTQPYIDDIHASSNGDLIFVASVATSPDGSTRRWALTRLDPATGQSTELAVTNGDPSASVPPFFCIGVGCGLVSGTEIDLGGVASNGTIYFSEHSIDPATGNQLSDLLALDPGSTSPREVAHLAGATGSDLITWLTVAKTGEAYFLDDGAIYQTADGSVRVLASDPQAVNLSLDTPGNLYVLDRIHNGQTRFGCATSTTFTVERFTQKELAAANPAPATVSQATYPGFIAAWAGSSSFFRVTGPGDAYWVASPFVCGSGGEASDEVFHAAPSGQQSIVYQTPPPNVNLPAAQGPLGVAATNPGTVYVAATARGQLIKLGR